MNIHKEIKNKLNLFLKNKSIPNILFYGPYGCGKKYLLKEFISNVYKDQVIIDKHVLFVDCELGKGIRFIREELKFFLKTKIINHEKDELFKSIILLNADKLTIDAQSALRRCIEVESKTNRFFIVVNDISSLQKPILSRFCQIYVGQPELDKKDINLYQKNILDNNLEYTRLMIKREKNLKQKINAFKKDDSDIKTLMNLVKDLSEGGFCAFDIFKMIKNDKKGSYESECIFTVLKKNVKNEELLMTTYLFFLFRNNEKIQISDFIKYG